jgi:FlaA1/EpsC-like NDP-sugar epimerase
MAEKIFSNQFGYSVLRYGNVVDSEGSFWHVWQDELKRGQSITVRCPEPTRFFLKLEDGIRLVEEVINQKQDGIFAPYKVKSFSVLDVANYMAPDKIIAGLLGPGEKQHEILLAEDELASPLPNDAYLSRIVPRGYASQVLDRDYFSSKTAQRMSPEEFVKKMEE